MKKIIEIIKKILVKLHIMKSEAVIVAPVASSSEPPVSK